MSGIYIKGMEMPESCRDCGIEQEGFWCGALDGYQNTRCFANERREDCPLISVPDHGRLIDADEFVEFVHNKWEEYDHWLLDYIEARPTIIPAEEGE